jgi:predicted DNA-binding antitoxin AbrB/MazE fold protein
MSEKQEKINLTKGEKVKQVKETFKNNLRKSNKDIQSTRAERISSLARMEYDVLVNAKIRQIFNIENDLEMMADISTSNVSTTVNSIKGMEFDAASFVVKRARLKDELLLAKEELETLKDDEDFYS